MCAVIGFYSADPNSVDISILKQIYLESKIRGKHATGAYLYGDGVSLPIPSKEFVDLFPFEIISGETYFIGHTRYSTSDLSYNQPIIDKGVGVVHNGVITQEEPTKWEHHFGYKCETLNDSELILKCFQENKTHPLTKFKGSSVACIISDGNSLVFFRNESRPLWYYMHNKSLFISSTRDILRRAFDAVINLGIEPIKCDPYVEYKLIKGNLSKTTLSKDFIDKQVTLPCSDFYKSLCDGLS